jgi:hypothetical protein
MWFTAIIPSGTAQLAVLMALTPRLATLLRPASRFTAQPAAPIRAICFMLVRPRPETIIIRIRLFMPPPPVCG